MLNTKHPLDVFTNTLKTSPAGIVAVFTKSGGLTCPQLEALIKSEPLDLQISEYQRAVFALQDAF